jgi:nuclear transport factor 2 (NTF2) superfamily protein
MTERPPLPPFTRETAIQKIRGERKFHWDRSGPRPDDHPGLTELGL